MFIFRNVLYSWFDVLYSCSYILQPLFQNFFKIWFCNSLPNQQQKTVRIVKIKQFSPFTFFFSLRKLGSLLLNDTLFSARLALKAYSF